jgi:hypothetical protein
VELDTLPCESCVMIGEIIFGRVLYSMFLRSKMSFVFGLGLLLLLLSIFCSKRNSRISVFLFKGLFFLITSFGLSMLINSRGLVGEGLLNANAFSVCNLCFDRPSLFRFTWSESTVEAAGSCSVAMNVVSGEGLE